MLHFLWVKRLWLLLDNLTESSTSPDNVTGFTGNLTWLVFAEAVTTVEVTPPELDDALVLSPSIVLFTIRDVYCIDDILSLEKSILLYSFIKFKAGFMFSEL